MRSFLTSWLIMTIAAAVMVAVRQILVVVATPEV